MLQQHIQNELAQAITIRHKLHQIPELKYQEFKTAAFIADLMTEYGYELQTGIAGTGIVAILEGGRPGKTVGLRADMDALPVKEQSAVAYISEHEGVMHACGHDGHMATLLLIAKVLKKYQYSFPGRIKFIFQPAEEGGHGAEAMVKAGVLNNPKVDAIFGHHNIPSFPINKVLVKNDCMLAGCMQFSITVNGKGGHSSAPEKAIDPVYIGSLIVQALQGVVSRNTSPFSPLVLSVTQFHAGTADNIIPHQALLSGTARFIQNEDIDFLETKIKQITLGIADSFGASVEVAFPQITPATVNTKTETAIVEHAASKLLGDDQVIRMQHNLMITEDFSFFLNKVPGCYFLVGTGEDKNYCHDPEFIYEDKILPTAAAVLAQAALDYLQG